MEKLAIIVPCFNEEKRLKLHQFKDFILCHKQCFLIFVNDGSSDDTRKVIKEFITNEGLTGSVGIVNLSTNMGKQEAVRQGMIKAFSMEPKFDYFAFFDADMAVLPNELYSMFEYLKAQKKLKCVIASRVKLMGCNIKRKASRHYLGRVFVTTVNMFLPLVVYDTQCGAKIFSRDVVEPIFLKSPFVSTWIFDVEILLRLKLFLSETHGSVELEEFAHEYPLRHWEDVAGSKIKPKHFVLAFFDILKIKFFYSTKRRRA